jgi:hypothetical protein
MARASCCSTTVATVRSPGCRRLSGRRPPRKPGQARRGRFEEVWPGKVRPPLAASAGRSERFNHRGSVPARSPGGSGSAGPACTDCSGRRRPDQRSTPTCQPGTLPGSVDARGRSCQIYRIRAIAPLGCDQ